MFNGGQSKLVKWAQHGHQAHPYVQHNGGIKIHAASALQADCNEAPESDIKEDGQPRVLVEADHTLQQIQAPWHGGWWRRVSAAAAFTPACTWGWSSVGVLMAGPYHQ